MFDDTRAHLLAALAQELAQSPTEESTAAAVTARAVSYVRDADSVSITMRVRRNDYVTLAASDGLSRRADELQYAMHEGPCLGAAEGHEWYRSGDVAHDVRWPRWGPEAHSLGVGSLLSVRLLTAGSPIGALNFYATSEGAFSDRDDVDFAILYGTHVAVALTSSRHVSGLQTALHSRHMIGIAQGILSERFGLDIDRAFDLLRRYSSTTNTKLSAVAAEIVRTRRLPKMTGAPSPSPVSQPALPSPGSEPPGTPPTDRTSQGRPNVQEHTELGPTGEASRPA